MPRYVTEMSKDTLSNAISTAYGEIESLAEEMREWADNIEEKFPSKAEVVGECADTLEQHSSEPNVPESIAGLELEYHVTRRSGKKLRPMSRQARCDNAVAIIEAAIELLDGIEGEHAEDAEALKDELDNALGDLQGIEFPGMFG